MPYTNTQFSSVVLKSTNHRHTLKVKPLAERQIPVNNNSRMKQSRKLKAPSKMKKFHSSTTSNQAQGMGQSAAEKFENHRKGVIMEDMEELEEGESDIRVNDDSMIVEEAMA